jgi:polysaccharide pyruvyl transferase CsaB
MTMQKSKKKSERKKSRKRQAGELHPKVVISGYYGFDNLGDELILRVLIEELKAQNVEITVLSQNPKKTASEYGVKAVKRTSFIDIVDALAQANLFISGGGGLFQDATGPLSAFYYGGLIHLAHFFEVPVCFWAQGVGPLTRNLSRRMTASALKRCEMITVRDEKSANLVEELIGWKPDITADPVWLFDPHKKKPDAHKETKKKYDKPVEPWRVGISLRSWPELTDEGVQALATCLKTLAVESGRKAEFLLLPFQAHEDVPLLDKLADGLKDYGPGSLVMVPPQDVLKRMGDCDLIVGMRFHSLILGLLYHIPVYGIIYDPKVAALLKMFDLQGIPVAELNDLRTEAIQAYLQAYPTIDLKPFRQKSRRNFQVLNRLLEIPEAELAL